MYYLTITSKRKNAKRHIIGKSKTLTDDLLKLGTHINDCYCVEIWKDWYFLGQLNETKTQYVNGNYYYNVPQED